VKISETIEKARFAGRSVLICYLPAGFPNKKKSIKAILALANSGADIIEIGLPYSDPVMDGPVIQAATNTALENGFKIRDLFEIISEVTKKTSVPIAVMSYWNPIVQYGVERFAEDLVKAGGVGIITPDLIPDEANDWLQVSKHFGLERIFLAAPTSSAERLKRIAAESTGFVYAVSTMGITGERNDLDAAAKGVVSGLRAAGAENVCVGIGVSTREQVFEISEYADGAIVGSHLVKTLENGGISKLKNATKDLKTALTNRVV
jgi:tryptophan synthase alpha chain